MENINYDKKILKGCNDAIWYDGKIAHLSYNGHSINILSDGSNSGIFYYLKDDGILAEAFHLKNMKDFLHSYNIHSDSEIKICDKILGLSEIDKTLRTNENLKAILDIDSANTFKVSVQRVDPDGGIWLLDYKDNEFFSLEELPSVLADAKAFIDENIVLK